MSDSPPRFALIVDIRVHPGQSERFMKAMIANARAAVRDEPDCHAFHVTQDEEDPEHFVLFELYSNAEALDVHRRTPHFLRFHADAGDTIAQKTVHRTQVE